MEELSFDVFSNHHKPAVLGESPAIDPESNALWWVDIDGKKILKTSLDSGRTEAWDTPEIPGFVVLAGQNAPALGMQSGIFSFDPTSGAFKRLLHFEGEGSRFNDAALDGSGRLWASTMALDGRPGSAAIHLVREDMTLQTVISGLALPNGMAIDLKRERFIYSDSHPDSQCIWMQRLNEGSPTDIEPRIFASARDLSGRPDGAALDQNGNYWIAGVDGSALYVFDLAGDLQTTVPVPFPAPTKLCFPCPEGRLVVVTSKQEGEFGGRLAKATLPTGMPAGETQPYWNSHT
ncbi:MAG: SMP-30/gluconolactonase/LRE family protein [Roseibium sp.]